MFTRANMYVYHTIGINTSTGRENAIANYIIINQDIEFYSSQGTLMGTVAHNVLDGDPLPKANNLTGSALFKDGNLLINRTGPSNPNYHLWYYNSSISVFCDFPLMCGEYGLCNEATKECSCPAGFELTSTTPACTVQDEPTRKCSCPEEFQMPKFNSTCIPVDSAYSLSPINVSFYPQPSAVRVSSQEACRTLCAENASCNAALFDLNSSSCALFSLLYTVALPSQNKATGQVMFLKITPIRRNSGSSTCIIVGAIIGGAVLILILIVVCLVFYWRAWHGSIWICVRRGSKRAHGYCQGGSKRLDQAGASAPFTMDDQFKAEVATIGSVSHVNLVTLKGFCMEKNARLLVFEFMPEGSLDKWLYTHEPQVEENISSASRSKGKVALPGSSTVIGRKGVA
ncbi:hypothetical protein L7F22_004257 [Adiantum nelumboides]|nr:hypothetical protein [Adiantum nelumboides]